jgi:hypothetical protein
VSRSGGTIRIFGQMLLSELLVVGYFGLFALAALVLAPRRRSARRAFGLAGLGVGLVSIAPSLPFVYVADHAVDLRAVWLLVTLPLAYWTPAPLAGRPDERLEAWLSSVDTSLGLSELRRSRLDAFELAYLLVYPMVPAGLLAVVAAPVAPAPETFWRAVLVAVLPCYGLLPLLPTRPPRAVMCPDPSTTSAAGVRRANVEFLATFGNGWNTLPSGHAAGAAAVAVVVWHSGSPFAPAFVLLAAGIAIGSVRGRYHYAVDTILGVALGLVAGVVAVAAA